jgi:hypothetical protein
MSGVPLILLAADKTDQALQSIEFWIAVGLLVVILLGGAIALYFTDLWRKRQLSPDQESTESLTLYRTMFERGELTETEYQAIRDRIAAQMKREATAARSSSTPGTEPAANRNREDGANPAGDAGSAGSSPTEPPPD